MRVAGIGFRKGVCAREVIATVEAALSGAGLASSECRGNIEAPPLDALATAASKADEVGLTAAAVTLGVRLIEVSDADLKRASGRCLTHSAVSLAATGIASVSEAAALAAAGETSRLLGPRIATGSVTCAIAQTEDEE